MRGDSDHELVRRSIDGDGKAFAHIIERTAGIVFSAVRSVFCQSDDVEDLVQDIYVRVYRGLPGFRHTSTLSTWVYRIARNTAINARARSGRMLPLDDIPEVASRSPGPDTEFARKETSSRIRGLIARLDDGQREIIELRYVAGKSYREIADILQLPEGTVKTNLYRAKARLRKMIGRETEESR